MAVAVSAAETVEVVVAVAVTAANSVEVVVAVAVTAAEAVEVVVDVAVIAEEVVVVAVAVLVVAAGAVAVAGKRMQIVCTLWKYTSCIRKPHGISGNGWGAHPLHPPPRSAPATSGVGITSIIKTKSDVLVKQSRLHAEAVEHFEMCGGVYTKPNANFPKCSLCSLLAQASCNLDNAQCACK